MAARAKQGQPEPEVTRQLGLDLVFGGAEAPVAGAGSTAGRSPEREASSIALVPVPAPAAAVPRVPEAPRIFGVAELVRAARLTLESRFADVRVEGEISNYKKSGPGHLYFCLKDEQASLDCVMYGREATRLRFRPHDGMAVRLRGRLTIYEGRGRFQMTVVDLEPTGAGALAVAFEQLKQRLQAAGLFDSARKRRLPFLPRRLGVVTSPQGAVIRDIVRVVHRRSAVPILLAPTAVQGPGAAQGIVLALHRLAQVSDVDVIIVARGGGSLEDLWSFNEEIVARAIAACRVPVISAVGHETDFTIADFVADVRAPTPSVAGELAVPVATDLRAELALLGRRAGKAAQARLHHGRLVLERCRAKLGEPRRLLDERRQLLDELAGRAHRAVARRLGRWRADFAALEVGLSRAHPHRRIGDQRAALVRLRESLERSMRRELQRRHSPIDALAHKLDALSPLRVLDRGYSLAFAPDGHLLTDARQVTPGDPIRVALRRGEIAASVTGVAEPGADPTGPSSGETPPARSSAYPSSDPPPPDPPSDR